ncbi:MAG TPA: hypothetical protein VIX17_07170 [Pyrinomonadaceae bacterium]|jgi:hypothetical protein
MADTPLQKPPRTVLDNQLSFKKLDTVAELGRELIKWSALVLLGYWGYRCVAVMAGTITFADIAVRILGNLTVSKGIIALLTGSGWVYGLAQRSLRRRFVERNAKTKNDLERVIDPKRTSSNLSSKGTTPAKGKR